MKRQKGQGMVEFALVLPLFFALFFGLFYSGLMFMDYLQYNNAVRDLARDISLREGEERAEIVTNINRNYDDPEEVEPAIIRKYAKPLTSLFQARFSVWNTDTGELMTGEESKTASGAAVQSELRVDSSLPELLPGGLLKDSLKIRYTIPLENKQNGDDEDKEGSHG